MRYQTVEGHVVEKEFRDFVARVCQHEDDHIRGIVFLDRLESTRDIITEKEYQKRLSPGSARYWQLATRPYFLTFTSPQS